MAQCLEPLCDHCVVSLGADARQAAPLLVFGVIGNLEDLHRVIVVGQEFVDADDDLFAQLHLTLERGGR